MWVLPDIDDVLGGPGARLPQLVQVEGLLEQGGAPVHVQHVVVLLQRLVVDPEDAVVEVCRVLRVVVQ